MRNFVTLAAAATLVAGCSGNTDADTDGDGVISNDEIAAEMEQASVKPQPGQYRATVELVDLDMPGAPEGAADMMRGMMSSRTSEFCLTQEEVDKGFEEMARQSAEGDCTFQRFDMDGGDFDAQMTCDTGQGGTMAMTLDGTGTATTSEMTMTMEGEMPGVGSVNMTMKTTNERIGECA